MSVHYLGSANLTHGVFPNGRARRVHHAHQSQAGVEAQVPPLQWVIFLLLRPAASLQWSPGTNHDAHI